MTSTPAEADEALTVRSRQDAHEWVGRNAGALAHIGYSTSISGASFYSVRISIQMEAADWPNAQHLLPEAAEAAEHGETTDLVQFLLHETPGALKGRTFDIQFVVKKETQ